MQTALQVRTSGSLLWCTSPLRYGERRRDLGALDYSQPKYQQIVEHYESDVMQIPLQVCT